MKKILLVLISALILSTTFVGCSDPLEDGYKKATTTTSATEKETEARTYENTFSGLKTYMVDKGHIDSKDKGSEMNAELIGAKKGYLYKNGKVNIELYEFKTKKIDKKAQETLDSVNKNGSFTIYDTEIKAYLTEDNKFMMIYNDAENNAELQKKAIKDFKKFNK